MWPMGFLGLVSFDEGTMKVHAASAPMEARAADRQAVRCRVPDRCRTAQSSTDIRNEDLWIDSSL